MPISSISKTSDSFKTSITSTCEEAIDVVKETSFCDRVSLTARISSVARYIGSTSKKLLDNARGMPVIGVLKFISLGVLPLTIYELACNFFSLVKSTVNEKIDSLCGAIVNIGSIGDLISEGAEGLACVGAVSVASIAWATPLAIACAIIQSIGLFLTAKSLYETHQFSAEFIDTASLNKPAEEYELEDFFKARQLIVKRQNEEKSFISKHFQTDSKKLLDRLEAIENHAQQKLASDNIQERLEAKQELKTTMKLLSQRMTTKKWSDSLNIIATAISLIGFGVVFSPCPPAGFALLAIGGVLALRNFFADRVEALRFEKQMQIHN